jgi:hypothetical protein
MGVEVRDRLGGWGRGLQGVWQAACRFKAWSARQRMAFLHIHAGAPSVGLQWSAMRATTKTSAAAARLRRLGQAAHADSDSRIPATTPVLPVCVDCYYGCCFLVSMRLARAWCCALWAEGPKAGLWNAARS